MTDFRPEIIRAAVWQIAPEVQKRIDCRRRTVQTEISLWHELSCCLLSSQVPYETAVAVTDRIQARKILTRPYRCSQKAAAANDIRNLLEASIEIGGVYRKYRFPRSRSQQLADTWEVIGRTFGSLTAALESFDNVGDARKWMVEQLPGLGPKQSSMFLRNIARSYEVAIIDRHVVRYMILMGICHEPPRNLGSLKSYEDHESKLSEEAANYGFDIGILDWAIWIVMRAASKEKSR